MGFIVNPYRFAGQSVNLLDSLVSWWSMDETSGNRVDSHGTNDLSEITSATPATIGYGTGKVSNCANLDASSAERFGVTSADFAHTGAFTVAWWFRYATLPSSSPRMPCQHNSTTTPNWQTYILTSSGKAVFTNDLSNTATSTVVTSSATWYFAYVYFDPDTDTVAISVNNETPVTGAATATWPSSNIVNTISIGGINNNSRYWDGDLDEIAYYKRVLNSAEIAALYNSGNGIGYPG